jgi:predicted Fe-S protein YdhL (DUF1289 family)
MMMRRHSYIGACEKSPATGHFENHEQVEQVERVGMIKSPCDGTCTLDGTKCYGCHRTMDEIIRWKDMTDGERQRVLDRLDRLDRLDSRS